MNIVALALAFVSTLVLIFVAFVMKSLLQSSSVQAGKLRVSPAVPSVKSYSDVSLSVKRSLQEGPISSGKCFSMQGATKSTKPSLRNVNVEQRPDAPKFRWFDVKGLKFDSWDAPDVHSFKALSSIADSDDDKEGNIEDSPRERFLPNYKGDLKEISIDDKTFRWGKLFAKPDAVFYDEGKDEYLVIEYKNREFFCLASLSPLHVLQLLISAEVVRKHIELRSSKGYNVKVKAFMRLNNKVTRITGWEVLSQRALSFLPESLGAFNLSTLSATLLARAFVLFDPVFKFKPQTNKDARVLGSIKHARMSLNTKRQAA